MKKTAIFLLLGWTIFKTQAAFAQETHFSYINKLKLTPAGSRKLGKGANVRYAGAFLSIYFYKNGKPADSLFEEHTDFIKKNNEVLFDLLLSNEWLEKADSIVVVPLHHYVVLENPGEHGNRGDHPVDADGKNDAVRLIKLKLVSSPAGADVYMIPRLAWETNPDIRNKKEDAIKRFIASRGQTPVWYDAQEYVYIALFKLGDKYKDIYCSPTHSNPVDSVSIIFLK